MAAVIRRKLSSLPLILTRIRPFSALPESEPEIEHLSTPDQKIVQTLFHLRSTIQSESDPERVANLFLSSTHINRFHANRQLFSFTVRKLSQARRPDLVKRVLDQFLTDPKSPKSDGFLARIISLYSSAGLPDAGKEAFCNATHFKRSEISLSALLSGYLHNGMYNELKAAFEEVPSKFNINPGLISHNILLNGLCENGEIEDARKLLDEMSRRENNRPEPDIVSYNTVLCGYLKKGEDGPFDELLKVIEDRKLEPDAVTFNCKISSFCKKGEIFKGEELLELMFSRGIRPSVSTFYHLICGYCEMNDLSSALRMFKKMKIEKRRSGSDGVSPSSVIYNVLIKNLVKKEQFDDALWICSESVARKRLPPFEDLKSIVEGLVKESKVDKAKELVQKVSNLAKGDSRDAWEKIIAGVSFEETASGQ